jgi:ferric-dicitrate binding protein FerR (iron transport regulator)
MLIKSPFISVLLILFLLSMNIAFIPQVLAQEPLAYGEIKASGGVLIESSNGKWLKMQDVYPLLNETKLKTGDGVVFITMKDGSRIDLSKETEAALKAQKSAYTSNLAKGTLSFKVTPFSTLTIVTPHATISAIPNPSDIHGIVSCTDKGTEVRSITGKINVSYNSQKKLLYTGERLFATPAGAEGTSTAATIAGVPLATLATTLGALVIAAGCTIIAVEAFRDYDDEGIESPSSPSP